MAGLVKLNGFPVVPGVFLQARERAMERIYVPEGDIVMLQTMTRSNLGIFTFGIVRLDRCDEWHDLEGACPERRGYQIGYEDLERCFKYYAIQVVVTGDVQVRCDSIRGSVGHLLAPLRSSNRQVTGYVIAFEEDVGGHGGDGLWKSGHCVNLKREDFRVLSDADRTTFEEFAKVFDNYDMGQ